MGTARRPRRRRWRRAGRGAPSTPSFEDRAWLASSQKSVFRPRTWARWVKQRMVAAPAGVWEGGIEGMQQGQRATEEAPKARGDAATRVAAAGRTRRGIVKRTRRWSRRAACSRGGAFDSGGRGQGSECEQSGKLGAAYDRRKPARMKASVEMPGQREQFGRGKANTISFFQNCSLVRLLFNGEF